MPAKSQAQQRFMGMVHAEKEGTLDKSKLDPDFAAKIEAIAKRIKAKKAEEFAETKHKGLPRKKKANPLKNTYPSPPEGNSQGQKKYAAAKVDFDGDTMKYLYKGKEYKWKEEKRKPSERLVSGIIGGGVPSALLTGALNLGSLKKNPKGVLSSAATAGAFGSAIGTLFSSPKKKTLVPAND